VYLITSGTPVTASPELRRDTENARLRLCIHCCIAPPRLGIAKPPIAKLTADSMYMWYTIFSTSAEKMKAYSIEFRKKIVKAYEQGDTSVRKGATRFDVSKAFVQKILKQKQTTSHVQPKKPGEA